MAYSSIVKPTDYFNTVLYTGNGSTQSITGVGFQPDWVWLKLRSTTGNHGLFDAVRGVTKDLRSNTTMAESTNANSLTAFGTDGFTVGSHAIINGNNNNDDDNYLTTVKVITKRNGSTGYKLNIGNSKHNNSIVVPPIAYLNWDKPQKVIVKRCQTRIPDSARNLRYDEKRNGGWIKYINRQSNHSPRNRSMKGFFMRKLIEFTY